MYFRENKCRRSSEDGEISFQSRIIREDLTEEANLNVELKNRHNVTRWKRSLAREERAFLVSGMTWTDATNVQKTCLGHSEERNLSGVEGPCRAVCLKYIKYISIT